MKPFSYVRAGDEARALAEGAADGAQFIAGGTTLVDLLRLEVMRPPWSSKSRAIAIGARRSGSAGPSASRVRDRCGTARR